MSSKFRITAARANGAGSRGPVTDGGKRIAALNSLHSTGPVTPEGKAVSSRNAIRHGLLADSLVLDGESEDRFCRLVGSLEREFQPQSAIETDQIAIMAVAQWSRMRLWSLEKASYGEETRRRRTAGDPAIEGEAHPLNRYETRFGREYLRAFAGLGALRVALERRDRRQRGRLPQNREIQ